MNKWIIKDTIETCKYFTDEYRTVSKWFDEWNNRVIYVVEKIEHGN